jgi:hypothetical protein
LHNYLCAGGRHCDDGDLSLDPVTMGAIVSQAYIYMGTSIVSQNKQQLYIHSTQPQYLGATMPSTFMKFTHCKAIKTLKKTDPKKLSISPYVR